MSPLAISIITLVAKYGPEVVAKIISITRKPEATDADWDKLFADIAKIDYDRAIAAAQDRSTSGVV